MSEQAEIDAIKQSFHGTNGPQWTANKITSKFDGKWFVFYDSENRPINSPRLNNRDYKPSYRMKGFRELVPEKTFDVLENYKHDNYNAMKCRKVLGRHATPYVVQRNQTLLPFKKYESHKFSVGGKILSRPHRYSIKLINDRRMLEIEDKKCTFRPPMTSRNIYKSSYNNNVPGSARLGQREMTEACVENKNTGEFAVRPPPKAAKKGSRSFHHRLFQESIPRDKLEFKWPNGVEEFALELANSKDPVVLYRESLILDDLKRFEEKYVPDTDDATPEVDEKDVKE